MSRTVFCRKYQKDLPGLDKAPFPGPKGQAIYEGVSAQAWQEWTKNQTMLINEHQLNVRDRQARQFLAEEQEKFLKNEQYATAAGYKPEAE